MKIYQVVFWDIICRAGCNYGRNCCRTWSSPSHCCCQAEDRPGGWGAGQLCWTPSTMEDFTGRVLDQNFINLTIMVRTYFKVLCCVVFTLDYEKADGQNLILKGCSIDYSSIQLFFLRNWSGNDAPTRRHFACSLDLFFLLQQLDGSNCIILMI